MSKGLVYLLVRDALGTLRRVRRRLRGPKGLIVGVLFGGIMALAIVGSIAGSFLESHDAADPAKVDSYRLWAAPGALLLTLLLGLSARSIWFSPAEVGFLFPAPLGRRELLVYNVVCRLRVQLFSALWCALFLGNRGATWYGGAASIVFYFAFLQLTAQCSGVLFSALSEATGTRLRRAAVIAISVAIAAVVLLRLRDLSAASSPLDIVESVLAHPVVRGAAWITRPFVEVYLAPDFGAFALWSLACCLVLVTELVLLFAFDVAYTEAAVAMSRRVEERLRRLRSGGGPVAARGPRRTRWSPPRLPFLSGAGPIAWRQLVEMSRHLRAILGLLLVSFFPAIPFVIIPMMNRSGPQELPDGTVVVQPAPTLETAAPALILFSLVFSQHAVFDFRRDLDRMSWLKSVPLRPQAIAAGQLLAMAILLTFVQVCVLGALALLVETRRLDVLASCVLLLPPLNWCAAAIDNALFLRYPYRITPQDAGQFPFVGRVLLTTFAKVLGLLLLAGLATGAGALAWVVVGEIWPVLAIAASSTLVAACFPCTWLVARSFERFDISRDMPE